MSDRKSMLCTALLALLLTGGPVAAAAQSAAPPASAGSLVNVQLARGEPSATAALDQKTYDDAFVVFNAGGFAALAPHLDRLRAALKNAPLRFSALEDMGDHWVIRADDADAMTAARAVGARTLPGEVKVLLVPNTYPRIAMILGSEAIERGAFQEALAYIDQGLALQPADRLLVNEKAVALLAQRRWQDTLTLLDEAFAAQDPMIEAKPAMLQRRRGYALVELHRLREAREAYEASLVAEPGNETAIREIAFIDSADEGRPDYGAMQITAPLAPKPEQTPPVTPP